MIEHPDATGASPRHAIARSVPAIFLVGVALFVAGLHATAGIEPRVRWIVTAAAALLVVAGGLAVRYREALRSRLLPALEAHTTALDVLPDARLGGWIALASGLGLFVELLVIRWHASAFQLFAYYKNVSLLAAFLGLGLGYVMAQRRPVLTPLVLPALGLQVVVLHWLRFNVHDQLQSPVTEQLAMGLGSVASMGQAALVYGFLIVVFVGTVLTCIPLGHLASRLMRRRPALVAYGWNLAGSLVGIALFSLLAYLWTPPAVWIIVAAAGLLPFLVLGRPRAILAPSMAATGVALTVLALPFRVDLIDVHSPYQIISLTMEWTHNPMLEVNHVYFQRILDLSERARQANPLLQPQADYYELPYRLKPDPGRVLVVGSGTGNDVAAGLRREAGHIDAVEIDPVVLTYGKLLHPERPYDDPRVTAIVEDARNFIRRTGERYELIVYGLLDSHTLLSGLSSVRLDSFVYTVEAFRDSRARLTPDGLVVLTFCMVSEPQAVKFFAMLKEAFEGQEPRVFQTNYDGGIMYVAGPGLPATPRAEQLPVAEITEYFRGATGQVDLATDDWPFLYMAQRKYPLSYLIVIGMLLLASLLITRQVMPPAPGSFSPICFFLGAGFMLIETKGITELGLVFGNTWQVVSAVIVGILVMAFLANLLVARVGVPHPAALYGALAGAILLGIALPASALGGLGPAPEKVLATGLTTLPLFFSGLAFSGELGRKQNVAAALSSNLLGAVVGGLLEYNSMYFGFRSLGVFALALYGLAFVLSMAERTRPAYSGGLIQPSPGTRPGIESE